jgi:hypothetical protein
MLDFILCLRTLVWFICIATKISVTEVNLQFLKLKWINYSVLLVIGYQFFTILCQLHYQQLGPFTLAGNFEFEVFSKFFIQFTAGLGSYGVPNSKSVLYGAIVPHQVHLVTPRILSS